MRNRFRIKIFFLQAIFSCFCSKFWKSNRVYTPPAIRGLGLSQSTEHPCWPDCSLKSCYYWLLGFYGTVFWPSDLDDISKYWLYCFLFHVDQSMETPCFHSLWQSNRRIHGKNSVNCPLYWKMLSWGFWKFDRDDWRKTSRDYSFNLLLQSVLEKTVFFKSMS